MAPLQNEIAPRFLISKRKVKQKVQKKIKFKAPFSCLNMFHRPLFTVLHPRFQQNLKPFCHNENLEAWPRRDCLDLLILRLTHKPTTTTYALIKHDSKEEQEQLQQPNLHQLPAEVEQAMLNPSLIRTT